MRRTWMAVVLGTVAALALGATPTDVWNVDFRTKGPQFHIQTKRLNTPVWEFTCYQGTNLWVVGDFLPVLKYCKTSASEAVASVTGTVSGATITFAVSSNYLAAVLANGYVALTVSTGATVVSYAEGVIDIAPAPEISAQGVLARTTTIYGPDYSFSGSFASWPFLTSTGTSGLAQAAQVVPYVGATRSVDLGGQAITNAGRISVTNIVASGTGVVTRLAVGRADVTDPASHAIETVGGVYASTFFRAGQYLDVGNGSAYAKYLRLAASGAIAPNGNNIPVRIMDNSTTATWLHCETNGNVGIGTNTPQAKLHVNGAIKIEPGTTFPTHAAGTLYYHSTSNKLYCSDGSAWNPLW